jgi:hypothetical protein
MDIGEIDGEDQKIKLKYISTEQQQADRVTKLLPKVQFRHLLKQLYGW